MKKKEIFQKYFLYFLQFLKFLKFLKIFVKFVINEQSIQRKNKITKDMSDNTKCQEKYLNG